MKQFLTLFTVLLVIGLIIIGFFSHSLPARAEVTAVIIIEPTEGLITDENGRSDSFTVSLASAPDPNIKIEFTSSDPTEGIVSPGSITLNPGNWDKPEQNLITVTGVADSIEDGDVQYQIIGVADSGDTVPTVSVTNLTDHLPTANDDYPPLNGFSPITIMVLENDTALNDTPLDISVVADPSDGTAVVNPDNTITYSPLDTFIGIDQFGYRVCDADSDCASADVFIEDQIPPEIISVTPVDVGGIFEVASTDISITIEVSDNFQVDCATFIRWDDRIEQYIDLDKVCQPPFSTSVEVNTLNPGWNQVYFQASDMAGNLSPHEFIWLYRVNHNYIPLVIAP
jgi:hypothetical protein